MSFDWLLAFLFVLAVVVVIHEAGHFLVARAVGIYCKTFSVGFGPKLLKKRIGETEYAISAFPLGGYVKMAGEGAMEDVQDSGTGEADRTVTDEGEYDEDGTFIPRHRFFSSKKPWERMAVVLAGPIMNLILAFVLYTGLALHNGAPLTPSTTLDEVAEGTPAAAAGLQPGDELLAANGTELESWEDLEAQIAEAGVGQELALTVRRGDERLEFRPVLEDADGRARLGVLPRLPPVAGRVKKNGPAARAGLEEGDRLLAIDGSEIVSYQQFARYVQERPGETVELRWRSAATAEEQVAQIEVEEAEVSPDGGETIQVQGRVHVLPVDLSEDVSLGTAISMGATSTWNMTKQIGAFLGKLVSGRASKDAVSGPVRIAQFSGEMAAWGMDALLAFIAMFSVNLFLLNLLPIPVLDGGHAMFIAYEMAVGRPPGEKLQAMATQVGFVALLLIMAYVIAMDVLKVVS